MAAKLCIPLLLAVMTLVMTSSAQDYAPVAANLRKVLTDNFSENRNHNEGLVYHEAARNYIKKTFEDNGLVVTMPGFATADPQSMGYNVIGVMPGKRNGTKDDMIIIVGAHFDTTPSTPGVDNNGSGLSAMLEALRLLKETGCALDNSIVFVAFDMKEEEAGDNAACPTGMCGSKNFVSSFLAQYLSRMGDGKVQGAIILDTMMNYDPAENAQETFLTGDEFKTFNDALTANNNKGDFLVGVGRKSDSDLITAFKKAWNGLPNPEYKIMDVQLDINGAPTAGQITTFPRLMDSDHKSFWTNNPSYSAIYLTDTDNKRGVMKECYHAQCDNTTTMLTDDRLSFLAKGSYAVSQTLTDLAMCSDPSTATSLHPMHAVVLSLIFGVVSFLFV